MSADVTGSVVGVLFGLDGFRVLAAADAGGEVELLVETTVSVAPCPDCGAVAKTKDRRPVWVRDLPIGGRPVVVCWHKRIWCCPQVLCPKKTWTEAHPAIESRACLTERARAWAFEQVGARDHTVAQVASALGVGWATIMRIVTARGVPIIDDPARLDDPTVIGVDETAFLRATGTHPTMYATGVADLTPGRPARLCDVVPGRSGVVLADWLSDRDSDWKDQVATASLDPFRGYATALANQLPDTVRVLDPFHVTKLGLTVVDQVRRRVQQDTFGRRGHRDDPLYRIRRVLRRRADRLSKRARDRLRAGLLAGDPDGELTAAWIIAQDLMRCYKTRDTAAAASVITAARDCPVPEVARLGRTLHSWRTEFLAHFAHPDVSNGPTESLNLKIKNTKRTARGFRNFANYRLRLLLNHGRILHNQQPSRIRTRRPRLVA
ncbi:ISL3 family transposase [Mycobacterium koreense]|uniref:ISL3 family transposase n=1 Tax=Mycolicibacillus koreensis TaxID=1069220 RepID=A0AA91PB61_9MYCO|nr:ISL3 family transposase [Mycolicibacillus koreensis]MCV7247990.1 ISL3 family transposase [Mycolicibacillus koreensis]OSC22476.1 ISL3 family transposase [Mycolicibacillus koreensis]